MIMQRQPDGSYEQIGFIKSKDGETIDTIVDSKGDVYFTQGFTREISGIPPLTLDSIGKNTLDYKIYGNSVQDGTPTPENPIEVQSVGDKTANLFNENDVTYNYWINADGSIHRRVFALKYNRNIAVVTGRTIGAKAYGGMPYNIGISYYDTDNNFISRTNSTSGSFVSTSPSNAAYGVFCVAASSSDDIPITPEKLASYKIMLTYGDSTAYEPYGYKIPVVVTGKNLWFHHPSVTKSGVTLQYSNGEIIFSGACTESNNFIIKSSLKAGTYTLSTNANRIPVNDANYCVNMYKPNEISAGIYNKNSINGFVTFTVNEDIEDVEYRIRIEGGVDYAGFVLKPQLELGSESTPYEPYHEPITTNIYLDEPLKTDDILKYPENVLVHADGTAENITLPSIPTFDSTTIISTDTEIQPSNMEIKYKARK